MTDYRKITQQYDKDVVELKHKVIQELKEKLYKKQVERLNGKIKTSLGDLKHQSYFGGNSFTVVVYGTTATLEKVFQEASHSTEKRPRFYSVWSHSDKCKIKFTTQPPNNQYGRNGQYITIILSDSPGETQKLLEEVGTSQSYDPRLMSDAKPHAVLHGAQYVLCVENTKDSKQQSAESEETKSESECYFKHNFNPDNKLELFSKLADNIRQLHQNVVSARLDHSDLDVSRKIVESKSFAL